MNANFRKGAVYKMVTNREKAGGFLISEEPLRYVGANNVKPFGQGKTKYRFKFLSGEYGQTLCKTWLDKNLVDIEFISYK